MTDKKPATVADLKPGDQFKIGRQKHFRKVVRIIEMKKGDILVEPEDEGKRLIVVGGCRMMCLHPDEELEGYLPALPETHIMVGDLVRHSDGYLTRHQITDPDQIAHFMSMTFEVIRISGTWCWVKDTDGTVHEVYDKSIFQKIELPQ